MRVCVTVVCRCLLLDTLLGPRCRCVLSLICVSSVPVWCLVLLIVMLVTNSGTVMPLAVANLGSRRRNRQMKLSVWPCSRLCLWLDRCVTGWFTILMDLVAGRLRLFRTRSRASPFVLEVLMTVIALLVCMLRLMLVSILACSLLLMQAPLMFLVCSMDLSTV